jgi:hypothetical protein
MSIVCKYMVITEIKWVGVRNEGTYVAGVMEGVAPIGARNVCGWS